MVEDWLWVTAERDEWNELGGYQIQFCELAAFGRNV